MTAIAYKDGIIAADGLEILTNMRDLGYLRADMNKIILVNDGVMGHAGDAGDARTLAAKWSEINDTTALTTPPFSGEGFSCLHIHQKSGVLSLGYQVKKDPLFVFDEIRADRFSIGCCSGICIGAMEYGASAIEAVQIAARTNPGEVGGKITAFDCKKWKWIKLK